MELNQDMQMNVQPVDVSTNNVPVANMMAQGVEKKKNNGMLIGLILCIGVAVGGSGFGVWAWMTAFAQGMKDDEEIMTLRGLNSSLSERIDELEKNTTAEGDVVFWPAALVHSDNKIYMINDSDKVVAVLEVPLIIQDIVGCSQAISEEGSSELVICSGVSNTGEEFGFSYDTTSGAFEMTPNE